MALSHAHACMQDVRYRFKLTRQKFIEKCAAGADSEAIGEHAFVPVTSSAPTHCGT